MFIIFEQVGWQTRVSNFGLKNKDLKMGVICFFFVFFPKCKTLNNLMISFSQSGNVGQKRVSFWKWIQQKVCVLCYCAFVRAHSVLINFLGQQTPAASEKPRHASISVMLICLNCIFWWGQILASQFNVWHIRRQSYCYRSPHWLSAEQLWQQYCEIGGI